MRTVLIWALLSAWPVIVAAQSGPSLPATCTPSETFTYTGATPSIPVVCVSSNVWATQLAFQQLSVPIDVTTNNVTTSAHGLFPKLPGGTTNFWRSDGNWAEPPAGAGGQTDDTALADVATIGALYDTTPPAITNGNVGAPRMDSNRYLYTVFPSAQAVTGTFWQATQPVSGTFWQATQPISGTVTANAGSGTFAVSGTFWQATQPVSAAALPLPTGAATAALQTQPGVDIGDVTINNAAGASAVNIQDGGNSVTVDGTFWQATQPVSGTVTTTPPANASTNLTQLAGTTVSVNSGVKDAGTLRVVLATDQPALTNKLLVTPDSIALPANQSVNISQINAVTPLMGTGATGTGSPRVTLATNSPGFSTANGTIAADSALVAGRAVAYGSSPTAVTAGNQGPTISDLEGRHYVNVGHPRAAFCQMAAATTTTLLELTGCAAVASNSYYISSVVMTGGIANAATVPALLRSGTGTNCATATATWATCWHGAAGSCTFDFQPPIKVTAGHAICAIDATVGTKAVMVTGYIAP